MNLSHLQVCKLRTVAGTRLSFFARIGTESVSARRCVSSVTPTHMAERLRMAAFVDNSITDD